jgi:hypothetical protein
VPLTYDPCHPIIDNIFFEFTGVTADQRISIEMQTGDFGRATIELSVNVICSQGYNGTDCNTFCEEINGILTCREVEMPTTPSAVNPASSSTICMITDPTSNSSQATDATSDSIDLTSSQSPVVSTAGGLIDPQGSDNTLAIAVGVGVGGAILLCLLVGLIILLLCLVCTCGKRRKEQKSKQLI